MLASRSAGPHLLRSSGRSALSVVLALAAFFLLTGYPRAQEVRPTASQVKAAYLFNFGKFVSWQADPVISRDSFEICVLGKDPFGPVLDSTVSGESIGGRKITVARLSRIPEAPECSVLFVTSGEESHLGAVLAAAERLNLLTVSDIPHFAERGGIIGLVTMQDRVRFEVNRGAAERSHLILSSELLKVAIRIIEKPVPGS